MGGIYFFDSTYGLVLIGILLLLLASGLVKATYRKYAKVRSASGLSGSQMAVRILQNNGIQNVQIERASGRLTDHYDSKAKALRLSTDNYDSTSVAAIAIAAHECGHAIQDFEKYKPLVLRSILFPVVNIGSKLGIPIIILGVLLSYNSFLIQIGLLVFALTVVFQLVTLPVEFNASKRAKEELSKQGFLSDEEIRKVKKMLFAAALTYVAATISAILQLVRLVLLFGRGSRSRN